MPDYQDDLQQYETLFRRHYPRLCRHVHRMLGDMDAAEDVVQEAFVQFWNLENRQAVENPEAYLFRSAINKALNYACSQKRRHTMGLEYQQQQAKTSAAGQYLELQELQQKVQQAIDTLPPACRKVFLLSRYEEMSHKEIAAFLNISTNTVDNHIKKALAILRKVLLSLLLVCLETIFRFFS
ncbi:RNA polymerase sigma-70 factor [Pontibacter chitinilyticus]|uniref:RNA polymerase sigma-70 factor n=1 Tax=Pontibacter chitinilyticus TaxID=2674989 RepID=UPI00321BEF3E